MTPSLLALLSFTAAAYAIAAYAVLLLDTVLHTDIRTSLASHGPAVGYLRVFGAAVALMLGPPARLAPLAWQHPPDAGRWRRWSERARPGPQCVQRCVVAHWIRHTGRALDRHRGHGLAAPFLLCVDADLGDRIPRATWVVAHQLALWQLPALRDVGDDVELPGSCRPWVAPDGRDKPKRSSSSLP